MGGWVGVEVSEMIGGVLEGCGMWACMSWDAGMSYVKANAIGTKHFFGCKLRCSRAYQKILSPAANGRGADRRDIPRKRSREVSREATRSYRLFLEKPLSLLLSTSNSSRFLFSLLFEMIENQSPVVLTPYT